MADETGGAVRRRHLVAAARGSVVVHFGGDASRQVAVGRHNVLVDVLGSPGAVVNVLPSPPPGPRQRDGPVRLVPRDFLAPLGRSAEIGEANAALAAGMSVELHAAPGWGKSSLLRHLANHPPEGVAPDGVVHLSGRDQSVGDLLQSLFDAFYETEIAFRPSPGQLRACLAEVEALLVVDDLAVDRDALADLVSAAPRCLLLAASTERTFWDEGEAIELGGLPEAAALALMERALGRPLAPIERTTAQQLCRALGGCPLELLRAGTLVREGRWPPAEVFAGAAERVGGVLSPVLLESSGPAERAVLGVLVSLGGAATGIAHTAAIAGLPEPDTLDALVALAGRHLAEERADGRWAAGAGAGDPEASPQAERWAGAAVDHFARWAATQDHPERLVAEADALVQVVRLARWIGAWPQLLSLARMASRALLLAGRWGAWGDVLGLGLDAARSRRDLPATAWFQHQLGTRALALGRAVEAGSRLRTALTIRRSLHDRPGVAATRRNLALLRPPARSWWRRPAAAGGAAAMLLIGAGAAALTVSTLRTTGHARLLPGRLDFGGVVLSGAGTVPVTISNDGGGPLAISRISARGGFQLSSDCPAVLPPHARCTVQVTFRPSAAEAAQGDLTVAFGPDSRQTVTLSGLGVPPRLQPNPAQLDFRSQPVGSDSAPQVVQLANMDTVQVEVAVGVEGDFAVTGGCVNGPARLGPGEECTTVVTFRPTAHGQRGGRLVFQEPGAEVSVPLTGFGTVAAPHLAAPTLDLGGRPVGQASGAALIALSNDGDAPFTVARVAATGDFTATGCARTTLAPGTACAIRVVFTPRAAGPRAGTLTIQGDGQRLQAGLTGVGIPPKVARPALTPAALDLGGQPVGQSVTGTIVLSNSGSGPYPVATVAATGDFTASGCSGTLAPGASCSISVVFTPAAAGVRTGTLTVQGGGGGGTLQANLTGAGVPPAPITPSPSPSATP